MRKIRVAINGFGRIGRAFFKLAKEREEIEIVAINDLADLENIAYLLKYDSAYSKSPFDIKTKKETLIIDGEKIPYLSEKDPSKLPWKIMDVDIVLESTGVFASYAKSKAHLDAGARRVVVSAPIHDAPPSGIVGATVLMGVNEEKLKTCQISSNASCTTNAASPIVQILEETLDIEKALLDTIHGYTSSQSLVDSPNPKDWRRGRAGAQNIVPSSTGAASAVTQAVKGVPFFDGIAVRVPVLVGSYVDLTFVTKKDNNTAESVNEILKKAAREEKWKGIFTVSEEPLVSSDIIGDTHASIADLSFTRVVGGNLIKVLSWYDNEIGYSNTLVEHIIKSGNYLTK
jgi:glyceraldehyde 3-phosphate dehydrogenase